jgi:hypothetical protein
MHANPQIYLHQLLIIRLLSQLFFKSDYITLKYIFIGTMFEVFHCESIALTMLYGIGKEGSEVRKG